MLPCIHLLQVLLYSGICHPSELQLWVTSRYLLINSEDPEISLMPYLRTGLQIWLSLFNATLYM